MDRQRRGNPKRAAEGNRLLSVDRISIHDTSDIRIRHHTTSARNRMLAIEERRSRNKRGRPVDFIGMICHSITRYDFRIGFEDFSKMILISITLAL